MDEDSSSASSAAASDGQRDRREGMLLPLTEGGPSGTKVCVRDTLTDLLHVCNKSSVCFSSYWLTSYQL